MRPLIAVNWGPDTCRTWTCGGTPTGWCSPLCAAALGPAAIRLGQRAVEEWPEAVVMEHMVGFEDGVFWENGSEPTHLYEIKLDGTGLRQLTDDKLYCDREPAYLPNGDVVFSSDRGCGASQCGAAPLAYSDFGLPNLFRVSADGQRLERLTYNKDVDRYPHCLNNGLIGYMRWDYQERFWQWPHALWTIRPDGTMNDGLFKVHFNDPQSVREPRSIPGSQKLVVIACGHHSPPEGAVAVVDPSLGVNNPGGSVLRDALVQPTGRRSRFLPQRSGRGSARPRWTLQDALAAVGEGVPRVLRLRPRAEQELCGLLHRRLGKQGTDPP